VDALLGHPVDLAPQRVHLGARFADHDPGPGRVDVDRDPLLVLLDQDVRKPGVTELSPDVVADLDVLDHVGREVLRPGEPVRLPIVDDADPKAAWVNLLPH
jgi:hypothetical protein